MARIWFVCGLLEQRRGRPDTALDQFSTSIHIAPSYFPDTIDALRDAEKSLTSNEQHEHLIYALEKGAN